MSAPHDTHAARGVNMHWMHTAYVLVPFVTMLMGSHAAVTSAHDMQLFTYDMRARACVRLAAAARALYALERAPIYGMCLFTSNNE